MGMLFFLFGGEGRAEGRFGKETYLLKDDIHGHPCARIAQNDVNRQNWTTSWSFFPFSCNRKKNHEKSPSSLGGLKDVLAMWNSRLLWEMIQFERLLFFLDLDGSTTNWPCVRSKYYVYKILNMCFFSVCPILHPRKLGKKGQAKRT